MNKTLIEWVKNPDGSQGYTWNPITGCLNGCSYCYARRLANGRLKTRYLANENLAPFNRIRNFRQGHKNPNLDPFYPRFWPERLFQPMNDRYISEKGIFVCDMSDLFGKDIPEEWSREVLDVIEDCPTDRFYLLTKQPQNLAKWSPFPENCWVGASATNQRQYNEALVGLVAIEAKVKFLSIEPHLEYISCHPPYGLEGINWVIDGAQSGPKAIVPKFWWVQSIMAFAGNDNIPVFLKNKLLEIYPQLPKRQELPR